MPNKVAPDKPVGQFGAIGIMEGVAVGASLQHL